MNMNKRIEAANKALIERGNAEAIGKFFASDYRAHAGGKEYKGHEFIKRFMKEVRTALPDVRVLSSAFLAREDETVTWQRTLRGTHRADMMGIPPSGKKVTWTEMVVTRLKAIRSLRNGWFQSWPVHCS